MLPGLLTNVAQCMDTAGGGSSLLPGCHVDNAAATRVSDRRKALGDHEQHEVQRFSRQQSSGTPRSKRERNGADSASFVSNLCSFLAVALVFAACLYWAMFLLMPKDS